MLLLLPGQEPDRDPVYLVPDPVYLVLGPVGQDLADLCIVSELDVVAGDGEGAASENLPGLKIAVARAAGEKCLRCWKQAKTLVLMQSIRVCVLAVPRL